MTSFCVKLYFVINKVVSNLNKLPLLNDGQVDGKNKPVQIFSSIGS